GAPKWLRSTLVALDFQRARPVLLIRRLTMSRDLLKLLRRRSSLQGRTIQRPRLRLALEPLEDRVTPAATSVRLAVIGDYGTGQQPEQDVANLVHGWNPDLIATTGDNNYSTPPVTA